MRRADTLGARLVAASAVWIVATLLVAGLVIVWLFRDHIERRLDASLADHLEELVAAGEIAKDGSLELSWRPFDPRFHRPHSGWYWQISREAQVIERSRSLGPDALASGHGVPGPRHATRLVGPAGESLRAAVQTITLPRSDAAFTLTVAGPATDVLRDVRRFSVQIAATLGLLALGLLLAVLAQIRFGLRPLARLRAALGSVREGSAERLPGDFPGEVGPLVEELNELLDRNAATLARARTQAADLAHALKNPLTIVNNEARELAAPRGEVLREQVAAMNAAIGRHLSRARTAVRARAHAGRTELAVVVEDLRFSLERLHRTRSIVIRSEDLGGHAFRGDPEDLEEMLGNLMDNACQWARGVVRVRAEARGARLAVMVEDDGPGVPAERRATVLSRGGRLDESRSGSGIGLAVVADIASAYDGSIELSTSPLGGLCATLELPRAEASGASDRGEPQRHTRPTTSSFGSDR